jgi:ABC-type transport system involved in cytochrome bd biosynthesis fused ATPase/permease subunit
LEKSYWGFKPASTETQPRDLSAWLSTISTQHAQNSAPKSPKRNRLTQLFHRKPKSTTSTPLSQSSSLKSSTKPTADIEVSLLRDAAHDLQTPAALRVVHLRKTFGASEIAVDDSNFVMHQGELLAVLGANGSGKSTTCHVLCGITPATAGDALVDDITSLLQTSGDESLVGWCPQHDILFDELTPLEHVSPFTDWN